MKEFWIVAPLFYILGLATPYFVKVARNYIPVKFGGLK